MNNEELNKIMTKADADLDSLKDRCHELYEENEMMRKLIDEGVENSYKKLKYLQQENERLEKEYKSKVDDIGKLTSKIYKAIEKLNREYYINEHEWNDRIINEVITILQGDEE